MARRDFHNRGLKDCDRADNFFRRPVSPEDTTHPELKVAFSSH